MKGSTLLRFVLIPALASAWTSQDKVSRRAMLRIVQGAAPAIILSPVLAEKAFAYERRDVGDKDRSALTAAMNEQAFITNNRLEASGFKLDTREEEQARLSNALSSFSYDSATSKKQSGNRNTGSKSKDLKSK